VKGDFEKSGLDLAVLSRLELLLATEETRTSELWSWPSQLNCLCSFASLA
jgi:hypothetical protein